MARPIAYAGERYVIAFATLPGGESPAEAFYDSLPVLDQAKLQTLFRYLGDHGRISNPEKFKKLQDDLREFKSFQIRMICAFCPGKTVVISHGFMKKSAKTPPGEMDRAARILAEDASCGHDED